MKLSIIIIQYKEDIDQMRLLLTMLNNQIGINYNDIECVVVNDCGTPLKESDVEEFTKLNPKLLQTESNGGAGMCRQYGIDHTSGEIITFFDADDLPYSLAYLKSAIEGINKSLAKDKNKCIWVTNMYEIGNNNEVTKTNSGTTWMHGKFFRREYLDKMNIRFSPKYRVQEDSYFLALAMWGLDQYVDVLDVDGYLWMFNPNSTTREHNKDYIYGKHTIYMEQAKDVANIMLHTDREGVIEYILAITYYGYYVTQIDELYTKEFVEYKKNMEKAFYNFYSLYNKAVILASKNVKEHFRKVEQESVKKLGYKKIHEPFTKFCNRIMKEYGGKIW